MTNVKPAPVDGYRNSSAIFIAEQKANPLKEPLTYKDGRTSVRILPQINKRFRNYAKSIRRMPYSLLDEIITNYLNKKPTMKKEGVLNG